MLRSSVFVALFASTAALCPSAYELTRNGECYRQLGDTFNYYAPQAAQVVKEDCAEAGGVPVIINNQEDNDYWLGVAKADRAAGSNGANYGNVMLGIECNKDHYWQWSDGTHINYRPDKYDQELVERCNDNGQYCMWVIDPVQENWVKYCNIYRVVDVYCTIKPQHQDIEPDYDCGSFQYDQDDGICYQVGAASSNYTEASTVCHSFGSTLASIHSQRENNFVRRMAVAKGLVNGLLLGGTVSVGKKKPVEWADHSKMDYDNFAPGFPLDGYGECLAMETNVASGQWLNIDCSVELPFACLRPVAHKDPVCDNGGLIEAGEIIYSPGFPSDASIPCDFLLKVDPGMLVEVEILFLEANSCCDHLIMFEGMLGGAVIADISGDHNNGRTFRTTSQNIMRVSWQPQGATNVMGMMITFRGVPRS